MHPWDSGAPTEVTVLLDVLSDGLAEVLAASADRPTEGAVAVFEAFHALSSYVVSEGCDVGSLVALRVALLRACDHGALDAATHTTLQRCVSALAAALLERREPKPRSSDGLLRSSPPRDALGCSASKEVVFCDPPPYEGIAFDSGPEAEFRLRLLRRTEACLQPSLFQRRARQLVVA